MVHPAEARLHDAVTADRTYSSTRSGPDPNWCDYPDDIMDKIQKEPCPSGDQQSQREEPYTGLPCPMQQGMAAR